MLQNDLNSVVSWSKAWGLNFNPSKSIHLSFKSKINSTYHISGSPIISQLLHKDMDVIISSNLSWDNHYKYIIPKSYKMLDLLHRCFSKFHSPAVKKTLYLSLVRSQITYCSVILRPYLIKDIVNFERIQRRATKFILNDYNSDYFSRLSKLELLPLMYTFDLFDIVFTLKSLKYPSPCFDIRNFITFNTNQTHSLSHGKLIHQISSNNSARNFFFSRIPRLWNALPPIDLSLSVVTNKAKIIRLISMVTFYLQLQIR